MWAFAQAFPWYVRGELLVHAPGLQLDELATPDALAVLYRIMVEAATSGALKILPDVERRLCDPFWLTDDTFGTGPTAEAGQTAMMELFPAALPLPGN